MPDGIEQGENNMRFCKITIILFAFLTITILSTSAGYAQFWETLLGVGSAVLENHIEKSSSYSSQEKESMRNNINTINNAINTNQNARNATKDAYQGNYTGAVLQGDYYSSKNESDYSKNVDKNKSFNSNAKTLSPTNCVVFKTDDGE